MREILFVILCSYAGLLSAQQKDTTFKPIVVPDIKLSDTIFPGYTLEPVDIFAFPLPRVEGLSKRDKIYLKKVYPYALRIAHLVNHIDLELNLIDRKRKKKKYVNEMEDMLKAQFRDDVKDLTRIQGQMLTKLVYRETNKTVYDLIKGYKNSFSAGWWNFLGKFYNQDLKMKYEPEGRDALIEQYVQYLDKIYQRDGLKDTIQNEKFDLPIQNKKRSRRRN